MVLAKLPRILLSGLATLALLGCNEDSSVAADDDDMASGDGDGDGDGDGEPAPSEDRPARGISITRVEANQGTAVFIAEGGEWVEAGDRLGPLIRDRNTLIRLHYELDSAWIPREVEARLLLEFEDGSQKVLVDRRMIDGPSEPNTLGGTFFFGLVGELGEAAPGTRFKVELHEVADGAGAGLAEGVWQSPSEPELLGIQPEPMELKIVFVPFHHLYQDIDRLADTSDANMKVITDYLYEQNAATELIWEVREPVVWDLPMDNLGSVLGPTAALRDNEFAPPNVYYHALFPVPGGGVAGVAGVASVPGDGIGEGNQRVSVTALGNNVAGAAGVVVHEVGHNEGMQHVYCPFAQAASPDPTYPYDNGLLGQWGFGLVSFKLYGPDNTYDYMSYCGPSWVSTWSWYKSFTRIRTLTSWDYNDPDAGGLDFSLGPLGFEEQDLLIGSLNGDGTEFWWTSHGTLPTNADPYGSNDLHYIELRSGGEPVDTLPAVLRYTNDYSTKWLMAELPEGRAKLDGVDEIVRFDADAQPRSIARAKVQLSAR